MLLKKSSSMQAESTTAIQNLDQIANVEGVDGVFFGPADLSASMGHVGDAAHPDVQAVIEEGIRRVLAAGKAPGILMADEKLAPGGIRIRAASHGEDTAHVFVVVELNVPLSTVSAP